MLAFESGLYDCWKGWQRIEAGEDPALAFRESVFAIWSRSKQMQPLIEYFAAAARSPRPLELAGFDVQFTGAVSERMFADDLRRVAVAAGMPRAEFDERIAPLLPNIVEAQYEFGELPELAARTAFIGALDELEERLRSSDSVVEERDLWAQIVNGVRRLAPTSWATEWTKPLMADTVNFPVRDRIMGEHLVWLARERYPGKKIIAWMHNGHAVRNLARVEAPADLAPLYQVWQPAGAVAQAELGDEYYLIALVAHHGQHQFAVRRRRRSAPAAERGIARGPLPPRRFHQRLPRLAARRRAACLARRANAGTCHQVRGPAGALAEVVDGVLYMDVMEPSGTVPRAAVAATDARGPRALTRSIAACPTS